MKDFRKNKQAFKQVHLLTDYHINFIHSLVLSYLITFQQKFKAAHNGAKKKKNTMRRGKAERKARGKYRMEPMMIVNWSHHV